MRNKTVSAPSRTGASRRLTVPVVISRGDEDATGGVLDAAYRGVRAFLARRLGG